MKVFISWSKPVSHSVAEVFSAWLPRVIQECRDPYISSDTDKGEAWFAAITKELRDAKVGIVFITPQNSGEEWIHLEAGAIYAALDKRLLPVLVNLKKTDYDGPLRNIQMTELADKADMLKLLKTINKSCDTPLDVPVLEATFETFWPQLQEAVREALAEHPNAKPVVKRGMEDKIDEILLQLRDLNQARAIKDPSPSASEQQAANMLEAKKARAARVAKFEAEHGGRFATDENGEVLGEVINATPSGKDVLVRLYDPNADPRIIRKRSADLAFTNVPF